MAIKHTDGEQALFVTREKSNEVVQLLVSSATTRGWVGSTEAFYKRREFMGFRGVVRNTLKGCSWFVSEEDVERLTEEGLL